MAAAPSFAVENLNELQRSLRRLGGTPEDAKKLNKHVVDAVIVPAARQEVPVRSGDLRNSIDSDSTATYGYILAGNRGDVAYAGVIHFGWSTRGLGNGRSRKQLQSALEQSGAGALTKRSLNKSVRTSKARTDRGGGVKAKVRGGPIRPQPFIYEAIDGRQNDVFREYEDQVEHRARIEGFL